LLAVVCVGVDRVVDAAGGTVTVLSSIVGTEEFGGLAQPTSKAMASNIIADIECFNQTPFVFRDNSTWQVCY
jgi:hypothetical protein